MRVSVLVVLSILLVATVYEILVALKILELGELPGEGPPGAGAMGVVAAIGMLAAVLLAGALAPSGAAAPASSAILAPAAGAYLLARFYSFDPYYLPSLIRYSERDFIPPAVVFTLGAASLGVGLLTLWLRRPGLALSVPSILVCALTAFFSGVGH